MSDNEYHDMAQIAPSPTPTIKQRDPFYVVKEKAQELLAKLEKDFSEWKDLLENTNTATNKDFAKTQKTVKMTLKQLQAYLHDLQRTIDIVNQNRNKFPNIDDTELQSRQDFVTQAKATSTEMRKTITSLKSKSKIESDQKQALLNDQNQITATAFERAIKQENNDFVNNRQQQQQVMEQKQDIVLEDMTEALARLGDVAGAIGVELKEQEVLIQELDAEVDMAQSNMDVAMRKMEKLLGTKDRGRIGLIIFLVVVAAILVIVVFYGI
eukprot:g43354.t1